MVRIGAWLCRSATSCHARGNRRDRFLAGPADYQLYRHLMAARRRVRRGDLRLIAGCPICPPDRDAVGRWAAGDLRRTHRRYTGAINALPMPGHLFQGRFGAVVMDEPHLLAATRYIALNPVAAGLVSHAEGWPWSSARAHLAGEDDELANVAPLRALILDFPALLTAPADPAIDGSDRAGTAIGRPLGAPEWMARLEWQLGRHRARHTGPKAPNGRGHQAANAAAVRIQVHYHHNPVDFLVNVFACSQKFLNGDGSHCAPCV